MSGPKKTTNKRSRVETEGDEEEEEEEESETGEAVCRIRFGPDAGLTDLWQCDRCVRYGYDCTVDSKGKACRKCRRLKVGCSLTGNRGRSGGVRMPYVSAAGRSFEHEVVLHIQRLSYDSRTVAIAEAVQAVNQSAGFGAEVRYAAAYALWRGMGPKYVKPKIEDFVREDEERAARKKAEKAKVRSGARSADIEEVDATLQAD